MSVDLSTNYLGLKLRNPLAVAACPPLTGKVDVLRQLEDAGASMAVLPSLFEEQIEHEEVEFNRLFEYQSESFAEAISHFPALDDYNTGPKDYLNHVEAAKQAVSIPIIGSLNGCSSGGWTRYAKMIEDAGADALELNVYLVPTEVEMTAADVEQRYIDLVAKVRQSVSLPLAVKLGQNFTSLPNFAQQLVAAGADGLVLFNRYVEADIDLDTLQMKPDLVLSHRHEARVPIRWIAILRDQLDVSLAATSGVHRMQGALKLLLAGADVTMMASVLLMKGPAFIGNLLEQVEKWLEENEYDSVEQMKGSMSHGNCPDPGALERANYMKALTRYSTEHSLTSGS
jgi:dihydroorotate dehydrogenase (fumarate)